MVSEILYSGNVALLLMIDYNSVFPSQSSCVSYIATFTVATESFFMILFYRFSQKNPGKNISCTCNCTFQIK